MERARLPPGLVGGHCIGVDPYYFIYQAEKLGYHSQIILSRRKVNDGMGAFVADAAIKQMILAGKAVKTCRVAILGLTFKENCPDIRNSKIVGIIARLKEYGISPIVADPRADAGDAMREYGVSLTPVSEIRDADCIILAVAHDEFKALTFDEIDALFGGGECVLIDVKSVLDKREAQRRWRYWRL